jgi:GNAT superfamily N-acetyltransferase
MGIMEYNLYYNDEYLFIIDQIDELDHDFKETKTELIAKTVIEKRTNSLAWCIFGIADDMLEIYEIFVNYKQQSKGIGSKIMQKIEQFAKTKECKQSKLYVVSNEPKRATVFYERNGYVNNTGCFKDGSPKGYMTKTL